MYKQMRDYEQKIDSSPPYDGIDFDWEVPDDLVVASPGGVDSTRHHPTKGMFGPGNTSSDHTSVYGQSYTYGEYKDMYTPNRDSQGATMFPNRYDSEPILRGSGNATEDIVPQPIRENFQSPDSIAFLDINGEIKEDQSTTSNKSYAMKRVYVALVIVAFTICILFWKDLIYEEISKNVFAGGKLSSKWLFGLAMLFTVLVIGLSFVDWRDI